MRTRIRNFVWGLDLGRVRRNLVLAILHVALLGSAANWARPRLNAWMNPPPPPIPATCTLVSIILSAGMNPADANAARIWIGRPNTTMSLSGMVWDQKDRRIEIWLSDRKDLWEIEFVCFDTSTPVHHMVFGEFETYSFDDILKEEQDQAALDRLRNSSAP